MRAVITKHRLLTSSTKKNFFREQNNLMQRIDMLLGLQERKQTACYFLYSIKLSLWGVSVKQNTARA